jgi:hypothetical protein
MGTQFENRRTPLGNWPKDPFPSAPAHNPEPEATNGVCPTTAVVLNMAFVGLIYCMCAKTDIDKTRSNRHNTKA